MTSVRRTVLALCFFNSIWGCAPVPRSDNNAEANPFLDELKFVDQKSVVIIQYIEPDRNDVCRVLFSTKSVDFNSPDKLDLMERLPARPHVSLIEKTSPYRFQKPIETYSSLAMQIKKFGKVTFDICQDGELYIVYCLFSTPKAKAEQSPTTARTPETKK